MSSLDYLELCRLCLVKERVSVPIFEGEGDVRQIFLKIAACLPVKVNREDKLPKKICDDCVYKVELFYQFWNTTANAEKQLLQWLGEVNLEDKQGYVTNVVNPTGMKPDQNTKSRLDGTVMQQVDEQQNNMGIGMMENMGLGMPMMMPNTNQQQITSVPMDSSGNSVQTVQAVPGPSTQTAHSQIQQNQTSTTQQEEEEEESEEDENSDDECDGDEGLPVKEEGEEDPNRTIEPTTFVNVSLACDEAGPSGLQQQKIPEMPEMAIPQTPDGDPKSGKDNNLPCANSSADVAPNTTALLSVRREVLSSPESRKASSSKSTENLVTFVPISSIKTEEDEEQTTMQKAGTALVGSFTHLYKVTWDSFSCNKCKMHFPVENMLNRHKLSHNMNSWLRKDQIRDKYIHRLKTSLKKLSRQSKVQQQLEKYEYVCSLCGFGCNRRVTLTMHARKKHKTSEAKVASPKIACTICSSKCSSQDSLNKHMNEKHTNPVTKYLCCEKCNFVCKRNSTLASHIVKRHQNESENMEPSPKKRSRSPKTNINLKKENIDRTSHQLVSESEKVGNENTSEDQNEDVAAVANTVSKKQARKSVEEQCNLCDFKCSAKSTMHSHKRQHKAESINEVYSCNECGFKTSKKSSLYSHIKRKHRVVKTSTGETVPQYFYCNQCEYKNKNKYELKVHVLRKHTDDFKFSCETCGKKFKVKGDLTNHIRFTHKEQPVICDVCGKTCLNSNSLYVHQKFAHYKAKYECPVCKRRMVSQENLNEHMLRQHERRENVVCEECGKTFSRNSRLKVHMRIHTGDKPYTCTICNKSFARRTALKQHLLIHTGIRPYVCDICGKAFTQKPGLISHRKSHPGTHPPLPRVLIDHILNDVMNN